MPISWPLVLIIFFSELHSIHDYGTGQQVPETFHHKRIIIYYGKKCCNMQDLLHGIVFLIRLNLHHYIRFPLK